MIIYKTITIIRSTKNTQKNNDDNDNHHMFAVFKNECNANQVMEFLTIWNQKQFGYLPLFIQQSSILYPVQHHHTECVN
ncbi:hypothetical protein CVS40_8312 [Lucilia cuprina]|nr:hypothetical protein CVS40_8312 [Lucilia cuprina]